MPFQGYIRYPHIFQDRIVFVTEDDLWFIMEEGGQAERLTAGAGEVSHPRFSPDGKLLAFVGCEEGPDEVYVMSSGGGSARRLTFQGQDCDVLGWSLDGTEILYRSNAGSHTARFYNIYAVKPEGGLPRQLPYGPADAISFGPNATVVLGRNGFREAAYWKRYRGGRTGQLWCDAEGNGIFKRLLKLGGNVTNPCWAGERIYFLSDHEGVGNVFSCTPTGEDIFQHTSHLNFYARNLSSDGKRLVYHAGAELYLFDPARNEARHLPVDIASSRTQRNRKFVTTGTHLDTYALHSQGRKVALTTRGKAFSMGNWEGPVLQYGERDGVRYRFLQWLSDGKRLVAVCDAPGHETLVMFHTEHVDKPEILFDLEFGRVTDLMVSPTAGVVALTNHRNELLTVDLEIQQPRILDRSPAGEIAGLNWSPDGRWIAYGFPLSRYQTAIKLCLVESGETHQVTNPVLQDTNPAFDPEGKYLYFIGLRDFNPVYDNLQFDLSFTDGTRPYIIMLQRDLCSPFIPGSTFPDQETEEKREQTQGIDKTDDEGQGKQGESIEASEKPEARVIDLKGIADRVQPFPVRPGRYTKVRGIRGKVLFLSLPAEAAIADHPEMHVSRGVLEYYDFENYKTEKLFDDVSDFDLSLDSQMLIYCSQQRFLRQLRVIKAGEKPKMEQMSFPGRESGWLDLNRVKVSVLPCAEWKQMFAEAWRLQREHFWVENMSGVDWNAVYNQYFPLLERVSSRSELSDLLWEMQGELGTSHAYEIGGDYRQRQHYQQGVLGVEWSYDQGQDGTGFYRITSVLKGDPTKKNETSPLTMPGLNVKVGDAVLAINGQYLGQNCTPSELLVNQADQEVQLLIEDAETGKRRSIVVKASPDERSIRYREWVERNRAYVHEQSQGRVGYIHIPDMMGPGFAEFHRSFLGEYDYPALLVDVRWNGGGHVSGLLLEKLARRRLGYCFSRWGQPAPYPTKSPRGPMVALANEHSSSDGDIFSHSFKLIGLGPLIGKRTWGGVIGITLHHRLVDGTVTTQPEYSLWFQDVGWNVENYGTDPDIEVDIAPQDFANQTDPQLERSIAEALRLLGETPVLEPEPSERPFLGRAKTPRDAQRVERHVEQDV